WNLIRRGGRHARAANLSTAGSQQKYRPGDNRTGPYENPSTGEVDSLFSSSDPLWTPDLHCAEASLRFLPARFHLLRKGQDTRMKPDPVRGSNALNETRRRGATWLAYTPA